MFYLDCVFNLNLLEIAITGQLEDEEGSPMLCMKMANHFT